MAKALKMQGENAVGKLTGNQLAAPQGLPLSPSAPCPGADRRGLGRATPHLRGPHLRRAATPPGGANRENTLPLCVTPCGEFSSKGARV